MLNEGKQIGNNQVPKMKIFYIKKKEKEKMKIDIFYFNDIIFTIYFSCMMHA